jgi:hypothetical protein
MHVHKVACWLCVRTHGHLMAPSLQNASTFKKRHGTHDVTARLVAQGLVYARSASRERGKSVFLELSQRLDERDGKVLPARPSC